MSYLCGLGRGFGAEERDPQIHCDFVGCDARIVIDGLPPQWFLDGKAKRGWRIIRDGGRRDYCPQHAPPQPTKRRRR
jgi:hypothetical protein